MTSTYCVCVCARACVRARARTLSWNWKRLANYQKTWQEPYRHWRTIRSYFFNFLRSVIIIWRKGKILFSLWLDGHNETIELDSQNFVTKQVTDIRLANCLLCIVAKKEKPEVIFDKYKASLHIIRIYAQSVQRLSSRLDSPGLESRQVFRDFSLHQNVRTGYGPQSAFYLMGTEAVSWNKLVRKWSWPLTSV